MSRPGPGRGALRRWGRIVGRHARWVVLGWVIFILAGFALATGALGNQSLFDRLHSGEITVEGENTQGRDLLTQGGSSTFTTYSLALEGVDLDSPKVADAAQSAIKDLTALTNVASAVSPYAVPGGPTGQQGKPMVSTTGSGFVTTVTYDEGLTSDQEKSTQAKVDSVFNALARDSGATSSTRGGVRSLVDAIVGQVKKDGQTGEGIALPISFVIMVIVFGGFLAAGLPLVGAIASIAGALLSLLIFSHVLDLDASVVNVITVLGLGLCIDYGLLVVSRFREEAHGILARSSSRSLSTEQVHDAIEHTVDRAGRTVIFSALTVAISLAGLFVLNVTFIRALAAAGVSVVLLALAVGLSLIPALCVLASRRILRGGRETSGDRGIFSRLARFVHARPWPIIVCVLAILLVTAVPVLGLKITSSGPELLPVGNPQRTFFTDFPKDYPQLSAPELTIVTKAPLSEVERYAASAKIPGVASIDPPQQLKGGVVSLGLRTSDGGLGDQSREAVASLRDDRTPFDSYVVGQASGLSDFKDAIIDRAGWAIALVCLVTLVLLFLMTGSLVIPVKALLMNLVSLGACLGAVVWVFQEGHGADLLGFSSVGAIESTIPILVLAFGFGLSMDYEVFLLSRIVELHEQGHDSDTAVTLGLQRSGRIITSAALLMIIVFAGFAAGKLLVMKQMGFGLVVAVLIDATLVRMLLVPATMTVLGNANWWAPRSLRRLHERFGITE